MYFLFFLFHLRHVYWSCDHLTYIVLISGIIYIDVCYSLIFTYVVSFISLCTCFLYLYEIFYFYFTLRCRDEFYLNCFRNTSCQSFLAMNSLLAKFFKSLY